MASIDNIENQSDYCRVEIKLTTITSGEASSLNLYRKSSIDGFSSSVIILTGALGASGSPYVGSGYFYDYLVEPGVIYKYSLDNSTYTPSNGVFIDSTGSFILGSSNRQLNFIYNSQVSDFKENRKDFIVETLGGQYPFVVRNANTNYKQFGFSGLIVSNMDAALSISGTDYGALVSNGTASNTSAVDTAYTNTFLNVSKPNRNMNFVLEKFFRKNVLSFLNDGLPKLFKSDTEGMYLGRITDVNLSPVEETGRILYNVTFTFTEIGDTTISNLNSNGMIYKVVGAQLTNSYDGTSNGFWG